MDPQFSKIDDIPAQKTNPAPIALKRTVEISSREPIVELPRNIAGSYPNISKQGEILDLSDLSRALPTTANSASSFKYVTSPDENIILNLDLSRFIKNVSGNPLPPMLLSQPLPGNSSKELVESLSFRNSSMLAILSGCKCY